MKISQLFTIGLIFAGLLTGCAHCSSLFCKKEKAQKTKLPKDQTSVINPNGDSELALLMRQMTKELEEAKQKLIRGNTPTMATDFTRILTATPTHPTMKKKSYDNFAQALLDQLNNFYVEKNTLSYNRVINVCIGCHQQSCPGPIGRIQKLMIYL